MIGLLRIFKYVRKRLIKLSIENKMLKTQLEYYRAVLESIDKKKHQMVKKKSKFRHISINKKQFYFYEIKWFDILGDSGHASSKEFDAMKPALMTTTGYVYSKDKKHLKTFASYDENEESFSDRNVFPIGCIKELKKILIQDYEIRH